MKRKDQETDTEIPHLLIHPLHVCDSQGWARSMLGAQNSNWVLHLGDRGSNTWVITCCLPGAHEQEVRIGSRGARTETRHSDNQPTRNPANNGKYAEKNCVYTEPCRNFSFHYSLNSKKISHLHNTCTIIGNASNL